LGDRSTRHAGSCRRCRLGEQCLQYEASHRPEFKDICSRLRGMQGRLADSDERMLLNSRALSCPR
jgi:hypothetical protein